MGSCFSKNTKHADRVERRAPKHKEIIAQGSAAQQEVISPKSVERRAPKHKEIIAQGLAAQQEVISPKIIEELRRVSSDSSDLLKELKEVEGRQVARGFGDRLMQQELKEIAIKYGYEICIAGNTVSLTKAERSHSL